MFEEIISFYPILMPIFLKSGFDGILSMAPLFMAVICGTMFSTLNPTAVVIASVSAGINFIDGIVLRIIGLAFGIIIAILYLFVYYKRIQKDETKSITYDIKEQILIKYSLQNKIEENKEEAKDKNKTKTNFTSKTSNYKKSGDDSSIVIHSIKNNKAAKRKTAKFEGIQMNEDNKVVNVIRRGSRTGSMKLNLNKVE
jgi:cell division protein FtsW (lipid II flippase)